MIVETIFRGAFPLMKTKTKPVASTHALAFSPAPPIAATAHFAHKLSHETDPSDVYADRDAVGGAFLLLDARAPEAFAEEHIPGAINLWHRSMDEKSTSEFSKSKPIVTYCASISCNASTKGALKLATLGFHVKEMLGGLEAWKSEGYPTVKK
jgi:rhodanese-related sulfurtransferase